MGISELWELYSSIFTSEAVCEALAFWQNYIVQENELSLNCLQLQYMPCVKLGESLDVVPTSVAGAECQLCCTRWPITVFFASVNITFLVKIFRIACKLFDTIALELKVTLKTFLHGSNWGDSSIFSQKWQYIIPIFPPQTLPSRFLKTFLR